MKLVARRLEDVSTAAVDFFSFGHALVAYILYIILNAVFLGVLGEYRNYINLISIFNCGLIWEVIENTVLFNKGIKFGYRKDSLLNSIFDLMFFFSGGLFAMVSFNFGFLAFVVNTLVFYVTITLLMYGYYILIQNHKKKIRI